VSVRDEPEMSVTRKIVEGARSSLNSLLDKVLADETPLTGVERDELDAELERRTQARRKDPVTRPEENPRARWAGAGPDAARRRRQAADAREARIRGVRAEKRKAEDAAREKAWEKLKSDAQRQTASEGARASTGRTSSGPRPGPSSSSSSGGGSRRAGGGFGPRQDRIAKYYKVLDLPYGAGFEQVKSSYRKLMRKYHPDLHHQTPQKAKAATELTMQVTEAYNELEKYLADRKKA
jgi:DnaJ-domain-containing protein 1